MTESAQVFRGVHDTPDYTQLPRQAAAPVGGHHRCRRAHRDSTGHRVAAGLRPRPRRLRLGRARHRGRWPASARSCPHAAPRCVPATRLRRRAARPRLHSSATDHAGPAARHHRQPHLHQPRRLRALSAHRAALLPATHQTPHRRGRKPPQPGARIALRHMDVRAVSTSRSAPTAAGHAARAPRQARLGHGLPADASHTSRGTTRAPASTGWPSPSTPAAAGTAPPARSPRSSDWLAGRDKDSDSSLAAYHRLAARHHHRPARRVRADAGQRRHDRLVLAAQRISRGHSPTRCPAAARAADLSGSQLPVAVFDEGDQAPPPRQVRGRCAGSLWKKVLRVSSPDGLVIPTAIRRSFPSPTYPSKESASQAPNSSPPSTISTPAPPSTSPSTWSCGTRKWKPCATTAPKKTSTTSSSSAKTSATATPSYAPPAVNSPNTNGC